jgi:hypothetical protein
MTALVRAIIEIQPELNSAMSMQNYPKPFFVLLFFLITIVLVSYIDSKQTKPVLTSIRVHDTASIGIDWRKDLPCFNSILHEMLADENGLFQNPLFDAFFASSKTRLVFSAREFSEDTSAQSGKRARFDDDWNFSDTIFLNSRYYAKWSREYLISVIIHEVVHDYITWSSLSFYWERNGVDTVYLRQHFPAHWEWLTHEKFPKDPQEHILMTENLLEVMVECLNRYTNPGLAPELRKEIAEALTWGGLSKTPAWRKLTADTCHIYAIDVWGRNVHPVEGSVSHVPNCKATDIDFFRTLQLQSICK